MSATTSTGPKMSNMNVFMTEIKSRTNGTDNSAFFGGTVTTKKNNKAVKFTVDKTYIDRFLAEQKLADIAAIPGDMLINVYGFFKPNNGGFAVRYLSLAKSLEEVQALAAAKKLRLAAAGETATAEPAAVPAPARDTSELDDEIPF